MKIGIFGDSYADEVAMNHTQYDCWVEILRKKYYPDLTCHARSGSSLYYSLNKLKQHHNDYDKVIFIVTGAGRFELPNYIDFMGQDDIHLRHIPNLATAENTLAKIFNYISPEVKTAYEAAVAYYKYLQDIERDKFVHDLMKEQIIKIRPDAVVVDITDPTGRSTTLIDISMQEVIGAGLPPTIFVEKQDTRRCHLSQRGNEVLAEKMHQWLNGEPAVLKKEDFPIPPKEEIESLFRTFQI
jgi:hypothetical protein